jgi:hypothetical protein
MSRMHRFLEQSAWLAWAIVVGSVCGLAYLITDSEVPFRRLAYTVNAPRPGEVLRVTNMVQRDLSRGCSVRFSRHMFDSAGTRIDLHPETVMTAAALVGLEAASPGRLNLAIVMPAYAAPGPAKLVTPLYYRCNVWHSLQPIESTMVIEFNIQPGAPHGP